MVRPPRDPYRLAVARARVAVERGISTRSAAARAAAVRALARAAPTLVLVLLFVFCASHLLAALGGLPPGRWVSCDGLSPTSAAWVEGRVMRGPQGVLHDPMDNLEVLSYRMETTRTVRRLCWNEREARLEPAVETSRLVSERSVQFVLSHDAGEILVRHAGPDPGATAVTSWLEGHPMSPALARQQALFAVVPGQTLVSLQVARSVIREGDRVGVYGVLRVDSDGTRWVQPSLVLANGRAAWRNRTGEATLPWLACLFLVASGLAVWLGCLRRRIDGVTCVPSGGVHGNDLTALGRGGQEYG